MNELKVFENEEFGAIRTVTIDNEPWFVGKDVAVTLGYGNGNDKSKALTNALADHVDDGDKRLVGYEELKGYQNGDLKNFSHYGAIFINESGLYALIFGSKLESAKRFKRWVTSEVLPSIRKHGMYAADELLENPDIAIKAFTALKEEREKNKRLEREKRDLEIETIEMDKRISELQPKANYVDSILQSKSTALIAQIAQDYGMSAKAFNKTLKELGVQRKVGGQWILYSDYQGKGYVHSRTINITRSSGQPDVVMQTEWTQKGRLFLYEKLKQNHIFPMIEK